MTQNKRPATTLAHLVDTYPDLSLQEAPSRLYAIATWKGQECDRCSFLTKVGSELRIAEEDRSLRENARKFLLRHVVSTLLPKADSGRADTPEHQKAAEICVNFYSENTEHGHYEKGSEDFRILHRFLSRSKPATEDLEVKERWFKAVIYARCWELINWDWEAAFTLHRYLLPHLSSDTLDRHDITREELILALEPSAWAKYDLLVNSDTLRKMSADLLRMQIVGGFAQNDASFKRHAEVMLALIAQRAALWSLMLRDHAGMLA